MTDKKSRSAPRELVIKTPPAGAEQDGCGSRWRGKPVIYFSVGFRRKSPDHPGCGAHEIAGLENAPRGQRYGATASTSSDECSFHWIPEGGEAGLGPAQRSLHVEDRKDGSSFRDVAVLTATRLEERLTLY